MSENEKIKADEKLGLFFKRLLEIKSSVFKMSEENPDDINLRKIYFSLDEIFKETQA